MSSPVASEKDEIKLRDKFHYQQSFFHSDKALSGANITDVLWVEQNINKIIDSAAQEASIDRDTVY